MTGNGTIKERFGAAAPAYDGAAPLQRLVAARFAARLAAMGLPAGARILEVGAGTGLLTRALARHFPAASIIVTDIAPGMLRVALDRGVALDRAAAAYCVMDAERPAVAGPFDLVCGCMVAQWFGDLAGALDRLAGLLAPGGVLAMTLPLAGSLAEWREAAGAACRLRTLPDEPALLRLAPGGLPVALHVQSVVMPALSGMAFLRGLRAIGADLPAAGTAAASAGVMRAAVRRFEAAGAAATWRIGTLMARRTRGVFVTGTDTGVGKTVIAAAIARAWGAEYWKPVQTGVAAEPEDSATVAGLGGLAAARLHPCAVRLQAPLSPEAAAALEGRVLSLREFCLPVTERPVVVEGAGGVLVPIAPGVTMVDLIAALGLPVVLVARSTLGTVNHTLLSIEALRARGVAILGVVLNGPVLGNAAAIAAHGGVRVIAEVPWLERPGEAVRYFEGWGAAPNPAGG